MSDKPDSKLYEMVVKGKNYRETLDIEMFGEDVEVILRPLVDEIFLPIVGKMEEKFDMDEESVRWYRRVLQTQKEARRVSHRYRSAFRDIIPEADLTDRLTEGVTEDGLKEAAEDIETDVSF